MVKRATSLFNLFCSDVAFFAAHFSLPLEPKLFSLKRCGRRLFNPGNQEPGFLWELTYRKEFSNAFTQTTSDPGSKLFLVKANFINQIVLLCFNSWYEISMRYRPFKDHKFFETVIVKLQSRFNIQRNKLKVTMTPFSSHFYVHIFFSSVFSCSWLWQLKQLSTFLELHMKLMNIQLIYSFVTFSTRKELTWRPNSWTWKLF